MEGENNNPNNAQDTTGQQTNNTGVSTNNNANQTSGSNQIDYDKIQKMIDGRNAKNEESVLKSYFQKQGLSEDEMNLAIESFKTNKAQKLQNENQNSLNLQNENATLKAKNQKLEIESKARDVAGEIGIDAKTVPFLIKLADLSGAVDSEGKISNEAIKTALNDVLEALPQLKTVQTQQGNTGFQKIGGEGEGAGGQQSVDDVLKEIFK